MDATTDKRRRNARPSKYRPRTDAQKKRRQALWEARADERKARRVVDEEAELHARLEELQTALRDQGHNGVHGRRHARPLEDIEDDAERFMVLRARVERLEALWSINRRKRETRGKIIIGGALLAELVEGFAAGDGELLQTVLDVLDRRVNAVRDRLTVKDLLGNAPLPLAPGSDGLAAVARAPSEPSGDAPDFDALVHSAMAEERLLRPGEIDPDYADLDGAWRTAL